MHNDGCIPYLSTNAHNSKTLGTLIQGTPKETMKLEEIVKQEMPPKMVAVGDIVSHNLHAYKITPQIVITDNHTLREK